MNLTSPILQGCCEDQSLLDKELETDGIFKVPCIKVGFMCVCGLEKSLHKA